MVEKLEIVLFFFLAYFGHRVGSQFAVPDSPCPQYYSYGSDGQELYGHIHIQSPGGSTVLNIQINFTIKAPLPSSYVGRITVMGHESQVLQDLVNGQTVNYKVMFPVTNPVPRVTSLTVNGNVVCYGQPDYAGPGEVVTTINLEHKLYAQRYNGHKPNSNTFNSQHMNTESFDQNGFDGFPIITNDDNFSINTISLPPKKPVSTKPQFSANPNFITQPQTSPQMRPQQTPPQMRPQQTRPQQSRPQSSQMRPTRPEPVPQSVSNSNSVQCGTKSGDIVPLVFNGQETSKGDWPWLIAVYMKKGSGVTFICAGTLISNEHIVTAAHCVHDKNRLTDMRDIVIKLGVHNLQDWSDDGVATRTLKGSDVHKLYNPNTLENDIMIMILNRPVAFTQYIRPACLWSGNTNLKSIVGKFGTVIGWGNSELGVGGNGEPRQVSIPIVSTDTCRASRPDFFRLTSDTTICAGDRQGSGPCNGDSGGGMYLMISGKWHLRGVVSLSLKSQTDNSCNLNEFVVFTDTAKYAAWIRQYV